MRRHLFNHLLWSVFQSSYITHYNYRWTSMWSFPCTALYNCTFDMWVLIFCCFSFVVWISILLKAETGTRTHQGISVNFNWMWSPHSTSKPPWLDTIWKLGVPKIYQLLDLNKDMLGKNLRDWVDFPSLGGKFLFQKYKTINFPSDLIYVLTNSGLVLK